MMWVAIIYAFVAMGLTHLVGRPLVPINFKRIRVEADFRYGLVRFRDNVEAVALARGATFEQRGALGRFQQVIQNWWELIAAQRNLSLFTTMSMTHRPAVAQYHTRRWTMLSNGDGRTSLQTT